MPPRRSASASSPAQLALIAAATAGTSADHVTPELEKKLKPVYDAIDHDQFKSALKLLAQIQSKFGAKHILQVLTALAYERNGQHADALTHVNALLSTPPFPVHSHVLSTLWLIYKAHGMHAQMTAAYTSAVEHAPNNDELRIALFHSLMRQSHYRQAQLVAIKLHQSAGAKDERFVYWSAMTLMLLHRQQVPASTKMLQLGEALIRRQYHDNKSIPLNGLQFLVRLIIQQGQYDNAIALLKSPNAQLYPVKDRREYETTLADLYRRAGKVHDAAKAYQSLMQSFQYDWAYVTAWLDANMTVLDAMTEKAEQDALIDSMRILVVTASEQKDNDNDKDRNPHLLRVEFQYRLLKRALHLQQSLADEAYAPITDALVYYYRLFGHKSCYLFDVTRYLDILTLTARKNVRDAFIAVIAQFKATNSQQSDTSAHETANNAMTAVDTSNVSSSAEQEVHRQEQSVTKLKSLPIRILSLTITLHQVIRYMSLHTLLSVEDLILLSSEYYDNYILSLNLSNSTILQKSTDRGIGDLFILLFLHNCLDLYNITLHKKYLFNAIIISEWILNNYNIHFDLIKLWLIRLYSHQEIGLFSLSLSKFLNNLEIKQILWENLSHLILFDIVRYGYFFPMTPATPTITAAANTSSSSISVPTPAATSSTQPSTTTSKDEPSLESVMAVFSPLSLTAKSVVQMHHTFHLDHGNGLQYACNGGNYVTAMEMEEFKERMSASYSLRLATNLMELEAWISAEDKETTSLHARIMKDGDKFDKTLQLAGAPITMKRSEGDVHGDDAAAHSNNSNGVAAPGNQVAGSGSVVDNGDHTVITCYENPATSSLSAQLNFPAVPLYASSWQHDKQSVELKRQTMPLSLDNVLSVNAAAAKPVTANNASFNDFLHSAIKITIAICEDNSQQLRYHLVIFQRTLKELNIIDLTMMNAQINNDNNIINETKLSTVQTSFSAVTASEDVAINISRLLKKGLTFDQLGFDDIHWRLSFLIIEASACISECKAVTAALFNHLHELSQQSDSEDAVVTNGGLDVPTMLQDHALRWQSIQRQMTAITLLLEWIASHFKIDQSEKAAAPTYNPARIREFALYLTYAAQWLVVAVQIWFNTSHISLPKKKKKGAAASPHQVTALASVTAVRSTLSLLIGQFKQTLSAIQDGLASMTTNAAIESFMISDLDFALSAKSDTAAIGAAASLNATRSRVAESVGESIRAQSKQLTRSLATIDAVIKQIKIVPQTTASVSASGGGD